MGDVGKKRIIGKKVRWEVGVGAWRLRVGFWWWSCEKWPCPNGTVISNHQPSAIKIQAQAQTRGDSDNVEQQQQLKDCVRAAAAWKIPFLEQIDCRAAFGDAFQRQSGQSRKRLEAVRVRAPPTTDNESMGPSAESLLGFMQ
jgi:hypothetical protein